MLADDHAVVRMGFRLLLEGSADIKVVREAESGEDAVRKFPSVKPDVVVMDISMPGIGGLEAIDRILAREPRRGSRAVCARRCDACAPRAQGRCGRLLSKRSAAEELIRRSVRSPGEDIPGTEIAQQLAVQQSTGGKPGRHVSEKEFKVFLALAKGQSVADIAEVMSLSPRTVGTHLYNIKQKLGASNSAELAIIAIRAGLVEP